MTTKAINTKHKAIKLIIKEVGLMGLIAIKSNRKKSGCGNIYAALNNAKKYNNLEFYAHCLIFNELTQIKIQSRY